eukprot:6333326-Amphidinium_carterae.1
MKSSRGTHFLYLGRGTAALLFTRPTGAILILKLAVGSRRLPSRGNGKVIQNFANRSSVILHPRRVSTKSSEAFGSNVTKATCTSKI